MLERPVVKIHWKEAGGHTRVVASVVEPYHRQATSITSPGIREECTIISNSGRCTDENMGVVRRKKTNNLIQF